MVKKKNFAVHLSSREIVKHAQAHSTVYFPFWHCDLGAMEGSVTTKLPPVLVWASVYQVFLKLGAPLLYFFKPHDVSR